MNRRRAAAAVEAVEFVWPVRVYYEDTDAGGVVYYANYLKFMERARTEWLRQFGFEQDQLLRDEGIVFPVRRLAIEYFKPARFNEQLRVMSRVSDPGRASLEFQQRILREDDALLCQGVVAVACVDARTFKPKPLPDNLRAEIEHAN